MSEIQDNAVLRISRRTIREAIFKLLYMSEFNSEDEMKNQMEIYFEEQARMQSSCLRNRSLARRM